MFANRNGFFYTIDRVTGKVIVAKPFVEQLGEEIGPDGRPVLLPAICRIKTAEDLSRSRWRLNFMSPS
jgi:glucose dehydrogenase